MADDQFACVAEVDEQVVGMVHAILVEPMEGAARQLLRELAWRRLLVNVLTLRTAFWRRGIGRQLPVAAGDWGRSRSASVALLDTYIRSSVSVSFDEHGMSYTRQPLHFSKPLTGMGARRVTPKRGAWLPALPLSQRG